MSSYGFNNLQLIEIKYFYFVVNFQKARFMSAYGLIMSTYGCFMSAYG